MDVCVLCESVWEVGEERLMSALNGKLFLIAPSSWKNEPVWYVEKGNSNHQARKSQSNPTHISREVSGDQGETLRGPEGSGDTLKQGGDRGGPEKRGRDGETRAKVGGPRKSARKQGECGETRGVWVGMLKPVFILATAWYKDPNFLTENNNKTT